MEPSPSILEKSCELETNVDGTDDKYPSAPNVFNDDRS